MIELKSFSSKVRVLGNGFNKEKSLREKLISSIDKEVKQAERELKVIEKILKEKQDILFILKYLSSQKNT